MTSPSKIVIVGVGLMGGSLGLALRRRGSRVVGWGRSSAGLKRAEQRGAISRGFTDPAAALKDADVVVLCVPVDQLVPLAKTLKPHIPAGALVMDVGSVKAPIVKGMAPIFSKASGPEFVGVHPMAGSEKTGVENARADLYQGAPCVITPGARSRPSALRRAKAFWRSVGGRVFQMPPAEHDAAVAVVSHLPHLLAEALMLTAGGKNARRLFALAAGSFRDATRVAGADPDLWHAIFKNNKSAVGRALREFQSALKSLNGGLSRPALGKARRLSDQFRTERS